MKHNYLISGKTLLVSMLLVPATLFAQSDSKVATFEELTISDGDRWVGPADNAVEVEGLYGSTMDGTFTSGAYSFSNSYNPTYASWSGFGYSTSTSTTFVDYTTDHQSATGSGYDGSATFAVGYSSGTITVSETDGEVISGCYLTNNTYALNSMKIGDSYAKKFEQGDYFKVIFTADNGNTVEFYLADMRSENESEQYILDTWKWCDLTSLGTVKTLTFSFDSSDKVSYDGGVTYYLNTPAYFCMDNFNDPNGSTGINNITTTGDVKEVARYTIDGKQIAEPVKGVNIVKMSDGSVKKVYVK